MLGTIHNVNHSRGFAFITPDGERDSRGRHFLHCNDCGLINFSDLKPGTRLEFESVQDHKGLNAKNVRLVGEEN